MKKNCLDRASLSKDSDSDASIAFLARRDSDTLWRKQNSSSWYVRFTVIDDIMLAILQVCIQPLALWLCKVCGGSCYVDGWRTSRWPSRWKLHHKYQQDLWRKTKFLEDGIPNGLFIMVGVFCNSLSWELQLSAKPMDVLEMWMLQTSCQGRIFWVGKIWVNP